MSWHEAGVIIAVLFGMTCNLFFVLALSNRLPGKGGWGGSYWYDLLRNSDDFTPLGRRYRRMCILFFTITVVVAVLVFGLIP
jgi:hypothetical protein